VHRSNRLQHLTVSADADYRGARTERRATIHVDALRLSPEDVMSSKSVGAESDGSDHAREDNVSGGTGLVRWRVAGAVLVMSGCQSHEPAAEHYRDIALQSAYEVGQVEMVCPEATPTVTSSEAMPPTADTPAFQALQLEYTVAVEGCGSTRTYLILCREDGSGCAPAPQ
jgi:hypothetical protein